MTGRSKRGYRFPFAVSRRLYKQLLAEARRQQITVPALCYKLLSTFYGTVYRQPDSGPFDRMIHVYLQPVDFYLLNYQLCNDKEFNAYVGTPTSLVRDIIDMQINERECGAPDCIGWWIADPGWGVDRDVIQEGEYAYYDQHG